MYQQKLRELVINVSYNLKNHKTWKKMILTNKIEFYSYNKIKNILNYSWRMIKHNWNIHTPTKSNFHKQFKLFEKFFRFSISFFKSSIMHIRHTQKIWIFFKIKKINSLTVAFFIRTLELIGAFKCS